MKLDPIVIGKKYNSSFEKNLNITNPNWEFCSIFNFQEINLAKNIKLLSFICHTQIFRHLKFFFCLIKQKVSEFFFFFKTIGQRYLNNF